MMYTTFCKALDDLFGGFQNKTLLQIAGRALTGKTTLGGYTAVVSIYKSLSESGKIPENARFYVVDCDGGWDWQRFSQIAKYHGCEEAEDMIEYFDPTEFSTQHDIVTKTIPKMAKDNPPLYIFVDAITALYRGMVLRTPMKTRASVLGTLTGKLDLQYVTLRRLSVKYNIPVTVVTWTTSPLSEVFGSQPESPFVGGRLTSFLPKIIVELRAPDVSIPLREAYLYKHRGRMSGVSCKFLLYDGGVKDVE